MKKIMIVPCVLNNCAKWSGATKPGASIAAACCMPHQHRLDQRRALSITKASTMYMMPIFLWSRLVSHSDQR